MGAEPLVKFWLVFDSNLGATLSTFALLLVLSRITLLVDFPFCGRDALLGIGEFAIFDWARSLFVILNWISLFVNLALVNWISITLFVQSPQTGHRIIQSLIVNTFNVAIVADGPGVCQALLFVFKRFLYLLQCVRQRTTEHLGVHWTDSSNCFLCPYLVACRRLLWLSLKRKLCGRWRLLLLGSCITRVLVLESLVANRRFRVEMEFPLLVPAADDQLQALLQLQVFQIFTFQVLRFSFVERSICRRCPLGLPVAMFRARLLLAQLDVLRHDQIFHEVHTELLLLKLVLGILQMTVYAHLGILLLFQKQFVKVKGRVAEVVLHGLLLVVRSPWWKAVLVLHFDGTREIWVHGLRRNLRLHLRSLTLQTQQVVDLLPLSL